MALWTSAVIALALIALCGWTVFAPPITWPDPVLAVLNSSSEDMCAVRVTLSCADLVSREYEFERIESGRERSVRVGTSSEFMVSRARFVVGEKEYVVVNGPAMGPGERGTIVLEADMTVKWCYTGGATEVLDPENGDWAEK